MGDLRADARALVRAGKSAFRPQPGDRERVLASLARGLGQGPDLGAVRRTDPPAGGAAAPFSTSSWVLGGLGALTVGAGIVLAVQPWAKGRSNADAPMSASRAAAEATPPPAVPSINAEGLPVRRRAEGRAMSPGTPGATMHGSSDSLPDEVRLLSKAEHQLSAGRADEALLTLAEHERRFPGGALAEERLAARVQSLCALGRVSEAKTDLTKLARTYPGSPHLDRARRFCGIDVP